MAHEMREFRGPDGTRWGVQVQVPGSSNAMVVFHHPGGRTARLDRYAWHQWHGPEARSVTGSLRKDAVMKAINPAALSLLFRRSMPISAGRTPLTEPNPRAVEEEVEKARQ